MPSCFAQSGAPRRRIGSTYLRTAVRGLRQKLEKDASRPRLIVNELAVGYRLRARFPEERS